jgi:hypothetical protein
VPADFLGPTQGSAGIAENHLGEQDNADGGTDYKEDLFDDGIDGLAGTLQHS